MVDVANWIMIVSGLLTLTMARAAFSPGETLRSLFGETLEGSLAEIVVRNWGVLVALVGAMLVYGGWSGSSQTLILIVAGISKLAFIGLVLGYGRHLLRGQLRLAIVLDAVFVALFALILII